MAAVVNQFDPLLAVGGWHPERMMHVFPVEGRQMHVLAERSVVKTPRHRGESMDVHEYVVRAVAGRVRSPLGRPYPRIPAAGVTRRTWFVAKSRVDPCGVGVAGGIVGHIC
jgi:hypothetical protein